MIKIFEENKWLAWMTTILIAVAIFIVSAIPSHGSGYGSENILAYFYHFFAFMFLSLFLSISLVNSKGLNFLPVGIFMSLFYAVLDELHQYFIPGRFSSSGDVLTDFCGILLGALSYYFYYKVRR